jgi:hypothetical protein
MVTITDYKTRKKDNGESFNVLILQGGAEVHKSEVTGKNIVNSRKASVISSLDDESCKALIGTKLPGSIEKVAVPEYPFQVPGTNEVIILKHSFEYNPAEEKLN